MRPPRAYSFRLNLPHAPRRAAGAAALLFTLLACALPFALARAAVAAPPADYAALEPVRAGALYLRLGASGTRVLALQHALAAAGESTPVNSAFDTATWLAVRRFQGAAAVGVDGVVGPRTIGALDRVLGYSPGPSPVPPPGPPALGIPPRPAGAESGSAFLARTNAFSRPRREEAILAALADGNLPPFLRTWREVTVSGSGGDGRTHEVTFRALPDVLAIGSDADFVRIPMNPLTAQRLADRFGASLPTRKMVDAIWRQAGVRLAPRPLPASAAMMSNDYTRTHQRKIEEQRAGRPLGALTAGHKKDVVLSNLLLTRPGRVAIYGWHLTNGSPIQPLSTVHENTYADYSHGIRLIDRTVRVDGVFRDLLDVLRDPVLARLLSDEGVMPSPRIPGVPVP